MSIASRRETTAPPAIQTSFDDSLLSVEHIAPSSFSPGNLIPLPHSPAPAPPNPSHYNTIRTTRRPPPLPQQATEDRQLLKPLQPLKPRKSFKNSLFNLFSAPNVERARGYTEPASNVDPPPKQSLASRKSLHLRREPSIHTLKKSPSELSIRRSPSKVGFNAQNAVDSQRNRLPGNPKRQHDLASTWTPPPLFQAYPQAVVHTILEAPGAGDADNSILLRRLQRVAEGKERARSRPSSSRHALGSRSANTPERDNLSSSSGPSVDLTERKIYVLVTSGFLLQYAGQGLSDRRPERILRLTSESVAFASDLIPGKHWVLQVQESSSPEVFEQGANSVNSSFLSKFGRKPTIGRGKNVKTMLLIFADPDDMKSWMSTIRQEIERLGGREARPPTSTKRADVPVDQPQSPIHYRLARLSRLPMEMDQPLSPTSLAPRSPTLVDTERMSGSTAFGSASDFSSTRSSTAPNHPSDGLKYSFVNDMIKGGSLAPVEIPEVPAHEEEASMLASRTNVPSFHTNIDLDEDPYPSFIDAANMSLGPFAVSGASSNHLDSDGPRLDRLPSISDLMARAAAGAPSPPSPSSPSRDAFSETSETPTLSRVPSITEAFPRPPTSSPPLSTSDIIAKTKAANSYFELRRQRKPSDPSSSDEDASPLPVISPGPIMEVTLPPRPQQAVRPPMRRSAGSSSSMTGPPPVDRTWGRASNSSSPHVSAHSSARSSTQMLSFRSSAQSANGLSTEEQQALRSARTRTSLHSSGPIPLRTATASSSPRQSQLGPLSEASSATSSPRMSMRRSWYHSPSSVSATSTAGTPLSAATSTTSIAEGEMLALRRPPSIQIRPNRVPFAVNKASKEPSPRASVISPPASSSGLQRPEPKRTSVLVPIVRPPTTTRGRKQISQMRQSIMNLPPIQGPPPSRALPALPPQATALSTIA